MRYLYPLYFLVFLTSLKTLKSQSSVQDCVGAIAVCQNIYVQNSSFSGEGNFPNEITGGCLIEGEVNDVWYIVQVSSPGNLNFIISPSNPTDDYDWAVYNLSNKSCNQLNEPGVLVSCNYSGTPGITGPNGFTSQSSAGRLDSPFNQNIPVLQGETYLINISNWSSTSDGYVLNFSASSASIIDDTNPEITSFSTLSCGDDIITFTFSEKIDCSTLNSSDFVVTGPGGVLPFSLGTDCNNTSFTENLSLFLDSPLLLDGNYSIQMNGVITDNCGNQMDPETLSFSIQSLDVSATVNNSNCFTGSGDIQITALGGTGVYDYNWSNGLSNASFQDNLTAGSYTIEVVDDNNCAVSIEANVDYLFPVSASWINYQTPSCFGYDDGVLEVNVITGNGPFTYSWSHSDSTSLSDSLLTGNYSLVIESSDGCSYSMDTLLSQPDSLMISLNSDPIICSGSSYSLSPNVTGGSPGYEYNWGQGYSNDTIFTSSLFQDSLILLTVRDQNLCESNSISHQLIINDSIFMQGSLDTTVCLGKTMAFTVSARGGDNGAITYNWSNSLTNGAFILIDSITNQTIKVWGTDGCGSPSDTAIININTFSTPAFNYLAIDSASCPPLQTTLIPIHLENYAMDFQWEINGLKVSNDSLGNVQLNVAGCHDVNLIISDSNQCSYDLEKKCFLDVHPIPETIFTNSPDKAIFLNPSYTFFDITPGSIKQSWNFGDGSQSNAKNPFHLYADTGAYQVSLTTTNSYGCINTFSKYVFVEFLTTVYVPTAFSPNNDGYNDEFFILSNGLDLNNFNIEIYDRWGHLVYISKSAFFRWDGTSFNKKLPSGVYAYKINAKNFKGDDFEKIGSISLIY